MIKKDIRPYEMSLWTLQDSFISVLKPLKNFNKGQIETPKITIKNDGTQELNFSVPMYYHENGKIIENPIWYDIKNGVLLVNLRKIKVIFNKGEEGEEIFEFIINQITETHTEGQLTCEVTGDGLAFQELGKIGYKISLTEDTYLDEYNEWWEETSGVASKEKPEPLNNINYWCDKIFKNSKWTYSIQMDWSIYDGVIVDEISVIYDELDESGEQIEKTYKGSYENAPLKAQQVFNKERENKGIRRIDKIYEEEYISSWKSEGINEILVPAEMVVFQEKARLVNIEKSNIYNITQTLAETFGVYCKYKYYYDENYHIIGRKCIFYNNFLDEKSGKIDINYPYDSSKIEREIDSADVVTKMFVVALEDETSPSGLVTIADVAANKTREDYILNFDYLYSIGTITEEQYNAIDDYERSMYLINTELVPISSQIAKLQSDLADYQAQKTIAIEGQTLDKEQMDQAIALMNSITDGNGELQKTQSNPYRGVLLPDPRDNNKTYYIKISQEGVLEKSLSILYYPSKSNELTPYKGNYKIEKDVNGNVYRISGLSLIDSNLSPKIYYLTFSYKPKLYYENIYNTYAVKLSKDEAMEKKVVQQLSDAEKKLESLEKKYKNLLEKKQLIIADFENLMGPAIKEGSWQAENYSDYGSKFKESIIIGSGNNSQYLHFTWDNKPFDEEQLNYYEVGVEQTKIYYPCISLKGILSDIKDYLDNLSVIYLFNNGIEQQFFTIGSSMQFGFLKEENNSEPTPVLIITGKIDSLDSLIKYGYIGVISSIVDQNGVHVTTKRLADISTIQEGNIADTRWLGLVSNSITSGAIEYSFKSAGTYVYPRLVIESLLLKTADDEFSIIYNETPLRKFYDYSILSRNEKYLITLNNNFILSEGNIGKKLNVSYALSNASLSLYLDALEVSKTNSLPQVSYTIEVSGLNEIFIKYAYQKLNKIVSINDDDLKFENVQGYISELDLNLDNPWEDEITIQNYKTKFEDLFSSIVASTEQMKSNFFSYDMAAGAFTSGGLIKPSVIQNTIGQVDLTYAFNNGNLTIDELNGIWATSDEGVVAMRGGGIFCATQKDTYGNWLWNTGITPSGINASLIRAGQIDTNLIKIYAGDNLRLQLNGQGLFAYRSNVAGEAKLNEYVVHNSDGLFLVQPEKIIDSNTGDLVELDSLVKRVEISWNGLVLRNNKNEEVFSADPDTGNLSISGIISASSGKIGGWQIEENYLYSRNGKAGLRSGLGADEKDEFGKPIVEPYDIFWAMGENGNKFKVQSDGTLFANNVIVKGTVSAGSFIGNATTDSIIGAIKKIDIISFNEDCFRHYNPNLDGVITADPSWLRFQIKTNGLTETELTNSLWNFYYCVPEELTLSEALNDENNDYWKLIDIEADKFFTFDSEYLTFIIKDDIMINGEDLIYLKVVKAGKAIKLDSEGNPEKTSGIIVYEDKNYVAAIQIRLLDFGTSKRLSLIEPPSFTFMGSQEIPYAPTASFTVNLKNINSTDGIWNLAGENIKNENVLIGSSIPDKVSIKTEESFIAVPEINLDDGKWFIDDELVQNGDIIQAESKETSSSITIINVDNGDGTATSTITIPHSIVPEGGQITLRYTIVDADFNISATRIAYVFKIKNGVDSYLTHISSTNGTIFRNGSVDTILEAELYAGITRLNGGTPDPYFYIWRKKEDNDSELTENDKKEGKGRIIKGREHLTSRFLTISNESFKSKALYSCEIYSNANDVNTLYNETYGEDSD